ncbi:copper resistance protein CopC [Gemmatimonas sp.]|jgi:methionine-rich copper-binding protein CopC|uniref:copper resistance protein CopC n=1 Tax=Gemmatimonas sp. TaxID=1962908 RepID=UPI0037C08509
MTRLVRPIMAAVAIAVTVATAPSRSPALSVVRLPHLKLKRSFPAKDTVLTTSPDAIRLWLTEKADLPATRITLATASGAAVTVDKPTRAAGADAPIEAKVTQPLAAGRYLVTWKTMSKDGHVVNGTFGFEVKGK